MPGTFISIDKTEDNPRYKHVQGIAASTWSIPHNLGYHPSITVVDSAGTVVEGCKRYLDENNIEINFSAPFSGIAYLN